MEVARTAVFNAKNQHLAAMIDREVTKLRQDVTAQEQGLEAWIAKEIALKAREAKKEAQCMESMYWQKQQVGVVTVSTPHAVIVFIYVLFLLRTNAHLLNPNPTPP